MSALSPDPSRCEVVVEAPEPGPGHWAGAPSAVLAADGTIALAYRLRRPLGQGRGRLNILARSTDGVSFETVGEIAAETYGSDSLERPAILQTPEGRWRCYLSIATAGSLHWRVALLEAGTLAELPGSELVEVLPGDAGVAYKDPVLLWHGDRYLMWVCRHRVADPTTADAMDTLFATSRDGIAFEVDERPVLSPQPGTWCARGARISAVLLDREQVTAAFDGRASYEENWEERTGLAGGRLGEPLSVAPTPPVGAGGPGRDGALRYLSALTQADGRLRLYYELRRADGAHRLVTELR